MERIRVLSFFLVVLLIVFVCGCGKGDPIKNVCGEKLTQLTSEENILENTKPYYLQEVYSEYAKLQYLPFETSSWEREYKPEFVMVHFMSGVTINKENPYDETLVRGIFEDYEIGINYVIGRDGTIECLLPENRAAWHAGEGFWNNDEKYTNRMNCYSIGIELLAIGSKNDMVQYLSDSEYFQLKAEYIGYTQQQYEALRLLLKDICNRQNIPYDRKHIIGHEEYNPSKTDPGELFEWDKIGL